MIRLTTLLHMVLNGDTSGTHGGKLLLASNSGGASVAQLLMLAWTVVDVQGSRNFRTVYLGARVMLVDGCTERGIIYFVFAHQILS